MGKRIVGFVESAADAERAIDALVRLCSCARSAVSVAVRDSTDIGSGTDRFYVWKRSAGLRITVEASSDAAAVCIERVLQQHGAQSIVERGSG